MADHLLKALDKIEAEIDRMERVLDKLQGESKPNGADQIGAS